MSRNTTDYRLLPRDKYYTPAWVSKELFNHVKFETIFDPACGGNHIVEAAESVSIVAHGSDLDDGHDFLEDATVRRNIVTNPPYGTGGKLALRFIEHALNVTKRASGIVAMLLPIDFDSASTRRHVFQNCRVFSRKLILTKRIRWANLPQKKNGPQKNHAWFVWDHTNVAPPVLIYSPIASDPQSAENIIDEVCVQYGVEKKFVLGPTKSAKHAVARQEAYRRIYQTAKFTLTQIGRYFGNRHHTTILYGIRQAEERNSERGHNNAMV
jgi:hypothetical protein